MYTHTYAHIIILGDLARPRHGRGADDRGPLAAAPAPAHYIYIYI